MRVNIPEFCNGSFFAGDTKVIKFTIPELTDLAEYFVEFYIESRLWEFIKTRDNGITTINNDILVRFEATDTQRKLGEWPYRLRLISPLNEVVTVAYGVLKLS